MSLRVLITTKVRSACLRCINRDHWLRSNCFRNGGLFQMAATCAQIFSPHTTAFDVSRSSNGDRWGYWIHSVGSCGHHYATLFSRVGPGNSQRCTPHIGFSVALLGAPFLAMALTGRRDRVCWFVAQPRRLTASPFSAHATTRKLRDALGRLKRPDTPLKRPKMR